MIDENVDIEAVLEFFALSGVDETCGDEAFGLALAKKEENANKSENVVRPAASHLAIAANEAVKSADDLCAKATTIDELKKILEEFGGCSLKNTAANTVMGDGNPKAKLMFIGEAPGADEDRIGRAFVGKCGQLLDKMLAAIGIDRESCYICNVLPWRPPGNRPPVDSEIAVCLPFLKRQIEIVEPDYIFALGAVAVNSLMGNSDTISRLRGKWMSYETSNGKTIKLLAGYHPSYLLRTPAQKAKAWADLLRLKKEMEENNQQK